VGIVFNIKRYAIHDGPGIRTTVFLKGCPLRCWWCHNPESQEQEPQPVQRKVTLDGNSYYHNEVIGRNMPVEEVIEEVLRDKIYYEESLGGVTFSGGEPFYQPGFLLSLLKQSKKYGLHTCIDTCGHTEPSVIRQSLPYTDLFLFDLKLMDDPKHLEYTGVSNELALKNLEMIARAGKPVIIRMPVIPGITEDDLNVEAVAGVLKANGLDYIELLPYHKISSHKYEMLGMDNRMEGSKDITEADLKRIKLLFDNRGISAKLSGG
jgi:pyruvate formate lyase activating enzyme